MMASLAGMLEVEVADLESALLTRVLAVSGEVMHKKHNLSGNKCVIISDRETDFNLCIGCCQLLAPAKHWN